MVDSAWNFQKLIFLYGDLEGGDSLGKNKGLECILTVPVIA